MKKILLFLLILPFFISCGVYEMSSQPRITHILAINSVGETVNIPINTIILRNDPYFYTNWRFYWGNQWYWGYNWWNQVYDPYWRPRLHRYYRNYRPNLRNYVFHNRNRRGVNRSPSVNHRRTVNNRPVINRNRRNNIRTIVRSKLPSNQRKTTTNRSNRSTLRNRN